jgi:VanZ family protein
MVIKKIRYFVPLAVWLAILFVLSSQPRNEQSIIPFLARNVPQEALSSWLPDVYLSYGDVYIEAKSSPYHFVEFMFRKSAHIFSYALLACAFYYALYGLPGMLHRPLLRWIAMLIGVGIVASLDEWNQSRVPMREGQSLDVWLDIAGGTVGAAVLIFIVHAVRFAGRRKRRDFRTSERRSRKPPG